MRHYHCISKTEGYLQSVGGRTEWKRDVILPVTLETTMVASVNLPATTALEEAKTVIGCIGVL